MGLNDPSDTTTEADRLRDTIGNVRVRFWSCPVQDHRNVEWDGDTATCPDCGMTNIHDPRLVALRRKDDVGDALNAALTESGRAGAGTGPHRESLTMALLYQLNRRGLVITDHSGATASGQATGAVSDE